ncbi:phosphate starvation-inducible protein PhoH [Gluconacetobacter johannae DSM 13595]|uniref:PhoH-like protein n=1 Tax=Gluconacetobacter johannae TaxID=112140 RepID=A0A7W4J6T6_9PROT|nr:PhoH family protein [Gluconacetobacter johannae]MBB2175686.1 PhoH family protein [Gluconacetobacter johannae]GBQ83233.1 phosphate starvation-inducible protein PhoH [Gluconacetobacter johannae DSM 13595]
MRTVTLQFDDNALLAMLVGDHDRHLLLLERGFGVRLSCRGNRIAINGEAGRVESTRLALTGLYRKLESGTRLDTAEIEAAIRMAAPARSPMSHPATEGRSSMSPEGTSLLSLSNLPAIRTRRGAIAPRSAGQAAYMEMLAQTEMVFGVGPAGTGKTYLAVAQAVAMLQAGQVDRIVLSRPAVEAGERLGFLPGDMKDKIDPYLRPLYDALHDMMPGDQVVRRMGTGEIEVAPLAFMRGRTLAHSFVILDEAQNTTSAQMKMFLTRMGTGTHMVVTGDLSQVDLPHGVPSGLRDAVDTLEGLPGIGITRFESRDVVRHPLVARIVDAYDQRAAAERDMSRSRARRENNGTSK